MKAHSIATYIYSYRCCNDSSQAMVSKICSHDRVGWFNTPPVALTDNRCRAKSRTVVAVASRSVQPGNRLCRAHSTPVILVGQRHVSTSESQMMLTVKGSLSARGWCDRVETVGEVVVATFVVVVVDRLVAFVLSCLSYWVTARICATPVIGTVRLPLFIHQRQSKW